MLKKLTLPIIEKEALDSAQKRLAATGVSPLLILGEIFYPFAGIDCPVIYSLDGAEGSAADTILTAMLIHFSLPENLEQLPEYCRGEAAMLLVYLIKQMEVVKRYGGLAGDCANLHKLATNKLKPGHTMLDDFKDWY